MQPNPLGPQVLAAVLLGGLAFCGLSIGSLSLRYYLTLSEMRSLNAYNVSIERVRLAGQELSNDMVEYARRNPAIIPLLMEFKVLEKVPAPSAAAPVAPKPTTR